MAILLKDIPKDPITPEEVELLANKEFDYADKERVSIREARRQIKQQTDDDFNRANFAEINKVFGTDFQTRDINYSFGNLGDGGGDFTFKEKVVEVAKAVHRGVGSVVKLPGVALKALGEASPNRAEREAGRVKFGVGGIDYTWGMDGPLSNKKRAVDNALRKAGNRYIDTVNGMTLPESPESRFARSQDFRSAPFFRTTMAVGESAPSYGVAIAATLTSGNPNIGLAILGTTTASSSYENLRAQGVDPDLAIVGATLEGSIEMLTEKVPMDILMKGGGRPFLVRALKLGTAESFQELFAQLGQNYVQAVVKGTDPDNLSTVTKAAVQEWAVISQGWQDAMAAGFTMGGGAAMFSPGNAPDLGLRTPTQMKVDYGVAPRNTGELLFMAEKVKENVKAVEKAAKEKGLKKIETPELDAAIVQEKARLDTLTTEQIKAEQAEPTYRELQVKAKELGIKANQTKEVLTQAIAEAPPVDKPAGKELGTGEEKVRGSSASVMAQAIEDAIVEDNNEAYDELPTYKTMNMTEQANKAAALIEQDVERAKRIAFYKEAAPPDLFPENVFTGLRTFAKMNADIDLLMDLALNEDAVREHTVMGKRIKSLDTDNDYADPVRAIREVVETRKEGMLRKGQDISALELKLRELQTELDTSQAARSAFVKKAERVYGRTNKIVTRDAYDKIITRRKKEDLQLRKGTQRGNLRRGSAYVPTASDFADIAKIATFHLEAMGRDFAKWSHQMTKDFGDWITPHLADEYDKALAEAKKAGVDIKESKRLTTKKKRLATTTKKIESKLTQMELAQEPRIPIELDAEGQQLQDAYDLAREKYKAAQAVANIITEEEVRIIAKLSQDVATRKQVMEGSKRREQGTAATTTEMEYGVALGVFVNYVNDLKAQASKKTRKETLKAYLANPVDFVSDLAGTMKAAKASLDNSFHFRQGLRTFLKGITGDIASAKIWMKTFIKSWKLMGDVFRKEQVMHLLFAEIVSDPDYDLLKKTKVAINTIEEEIPVDIPSRIPLIGVLFKMGENAFVGSSRYMRYQVAKQYLNVWRKSGRPLSKTELESIGKLANSQTGRGDTGSISQKPGLINNLFWSPRNLKAHVDTLTAHSFDRNISPFARKQAALNLIRYISGAAMILAMAKWIDDDSVVTDPKSADFGKIKAGSTRFSVGGGMEILVILASRLATREFTSSTTGKTRSIDSGKFGAMGGKDLVYNFFENKLSPATAMTLSLIDQKTRQGDKLVIPQMVNDAFTPLIIQNVMETGSSDDAANVLAALMAEALGVNVQTYTNEKTKPKGRSKL